MKTSQVRFGLLFLVASGALLFCSARAQQLAVPPSGPAMTSNLPAAESLPIVAGDIIAVHVFDDTDLDQAHLRVTDAGTVPLLLLGPIRVTGLTPGEAGTVIANAYVQHNLLINAHVQVTVESISSADVTVFGNVNGVTGQTNGIAFTLNSPRPLLTVLAMAGGFNDRASHTVTIERRGPEKQRITVRLPVDPIEDLSNDPMVYPGDIVVVPRAGIVYVLGNVTQPKGIVMNEDGKLSLLQAISQSAGPLPTSSLKSLMLFRKENGEYKAIPVNLGKILHGKAPDIALAPEDAIYVPFSVGKNLLVNASGITAALASSTATGLIYTH